MANNEVTTKFKVDISNLKKGIQEANRQIRLASAEFKAASSGMENWQKSTDGLEAKIESLEKTLKAQKSILSSYEKQLELIVKEEGANSKGADEMRIKIANQKATINQTEKSLKGFKDQLSEVKKSQDESTKAAEKQTSAYDKLQKEIQDQEKELEELKKDYANAVIEQGKTSDSAKELGSKIDQLSKDLGENRDKLKEAEYQTEELDDAMDKTTNGGLSAFTVALGNLAADAITKAIDKMKEFITTTVELGISFDTAMSKVGAISGATTEDMEKLRAKAKEMGASTKFTATEAAEAFQYMAMAGWKTDDMLSGIDGILNLAAASGADLGQTSDIVTDALTAFGYTAQDAGHFADVLAAAASNANTNVEMMGASFKYAAPVAGAMGYSAEDVAVALGLMANQSIKADMAGTTLRSIMQRMADASGETKEAMDRLGLSLYDDNGRMYSLMEIMQKLRSSMGSINMPMDEFTRQCESLDAQLEDGTLTQSAYDKQLEELTKRAFGAAGAEKARAASMLGGARAMSGLLAIANTSEEDFSKLTDAIYGSEGAAQNMADTMLDNLGGDVTKLKSKLEGTKLELYEKFEPALRSGTKVLGAFIDGLQWLIDHSSEVAAAIDGIATSLITFFIIVKRQALLAGLIKLITSLKTALTVLFGVIAANPVGALIAILAGLVTALITLWNTSEDFRNFWIGVWEDIKRAVERQGKLIKDFWSGVGDALIGGVKRQYELITGYWSNIGKGIKEKAQDAYDGITGIFEAIPDWFESKFSAAWKAVKDVFSEGGEIFLGIKEGIETTFTTIVNGLIKGINKIITQPFKAINKTLNKIRSVGIGKVHPFKGLWDADPISIPEIPYLEKGGILKKGQIGLLEGNGAEAVVPLDKNRKWVASVVREMDRASGGTTIGKTVTNNYNFNQTITSPKALSRLDIYRQTKNQLNFAKGVG